VREDYQFLQDERIAEANYYGNLARLSVMWTAGSFCSYLLLYLNKYLSGGVFVNYYFDGVAGIAAYCIGKPLYSYCKIRNAFLVSYIVTLVGLLGIFLFESKMASPDFIAYLGAPPSPYPPGSPEDREHHLKSILPAFTLIAKIGTGITFSNAYQASFSDGKTFPLLKRSTAIGVCNMVSRGITAVSPLCAELDQPIPIIIMICITVIAEAVACTFPSPAEERRLQAELLKDASNLGAGESGKSKEI